MKSKKTIITICVIAIIAVIAGLAACAPKANKAVVGNPTPNVKEANVTPTPDKFGVVKATQWAEAYPYEYESYLANASNTPPAADYQAKDGVYALGATIDDTTSALPEGYTYVDAGKMDYLETNPEIKVLGKGYGYAKYYTEPASHVYSLWTVTHNGRVADGTKTKAACITCKSPQYSGLVDMEGEGVHKLAFNDVVGELDENISCASCHGNTPMVDGKVYLEVDRAEWVRSMGADAGKTINGEVCGQCHCDYSMAPETSIPTSPYDNGRVDMVPEKALQWYDDHGFVDWTYASTGAKMLAIRHAEYEFVYGGDNEILHQGSHMQNLGYDCNDCHMATTTASDGTTYASHEWISPLDNKELIWSPINKICAEGIALSPEGRHVFSDLTVLENLMIGAYLRKDKETIQKDLEWIYELFPRLKERSWQFAGTLSGGEQQMLALGRALMSRPKVLMLDEPSLGLAPLIVQQIFDIIREINKKGVTILLVEQNANMALKTADIAYVLETGEIVLQGSGKELLENPTVREAYLGKKK